MSQKMKIKKEFLVKRTTFSRIATEFNIQPKLIKISLNK